MRTRMGWWGRLRRLPKVFAGDEGADGGAPDVARAIARNANVVAKKHGFTLASGKKEAGRQITMLQAFHVANSVTTNHYFAPEAALLNVALQKAYYASGRGVLYEVRPDWSLITINSQPEDWVTTEAMGIVLEALFSLSSPEPW